MCRKKDILENMNQWNEDIAKEIASDVGIELTDKHFEVLNYLREKTEAGESLTIRKVGKSGITDIKGLVQIISKRPFESSQQKLQEFLNQPVAYNIELNDNKNITR